MAVTTGTRPVGHRIGGIVLIAGVLVGLAAPGAAVAAAPRAADAATPTATPTTPVGPSASVGTSATDGVGASAAPVVATPTPIATRVTETTTAARGPLPGWAVAVIVALALAGGLAAYPARRRH